MQAYPQKPPYCSIRAFRRGLEVLRTCASGDVVDAARLAEGSLSANAAYPVLHALKFLGLLDGESRVTGRHLVFYKPEEDRRRCLDELVREKYGPLLAALGLPITDMDSLLGAFQTSFGTAESVAVLNQSFFLWLCREAGIPLFGRSRPLPRRRRVKGASDLRVTAGEAGLPGQAPVSIVCHLQVTHDLTVEQIKAMILRVREAIRDPGR